MSGDRKTGFSGGNIFGSCASQGRESLSAQKEKKKGGKAREEEWKYLTSRAMVNVMTVPNSLFLVSFPGVDQVYFLPFGFNEISIYLSISHINKNSN